LAYSVAAMLACVESLRRKSWPELGPNPYILFSYLCMHVHRETASRLFRAAASRRSGSLGSVVVTGSRRPRRVRKLESLNFFHRFHPLQEASVCRVLSVLARQKSILKCFEIPGLG
jgi:hypothetical protein